MLDTIETELRSITKSQEANQTVFVRNKKFSEAASVRIIYWFKKLLTYLAKSQPNIQPSAPVTIPKRMKSLIRNYIYLDDNLAKVAYFLFRRQIMFTLEYYSPVQVNREELTVKNIDEAVQDRNSPYHPYYQQLRLVHAIAEQYE